MTMVSFNPVGWFELYVDDMSRAKVFYETVFATELTEISSPHPTVKMLAFTMLEDGK